MPDQPEKEKPEPKKPDPAKKKTEKEAKEAKETNGKLTANSIVSSERGCDYLVERMLGQGGFGEVWKVSELDDPDKRYAMKIEPNFHEKKHMLRLKCEVNLFDAIANSDPKKIDRTHFLRMHDRGKTTAFKYYVMDLIWLSLREVKKKICGNVFSPSTTIKVARQTLKAIEVLHELGFLHRDIKPHNYAVGLPPKDDILYLIDFGIARIYRDKDSKIRVARKTVNFMGTLMYASMESLARNEQARRDDLEMWLWMMLEIYDPNNLTWGKLDTEDLFAYIEARQELMMNSRELRREGKLKMPEIWCTIMDMINDLDFEQTPDYEGINHNLSLMCLDLGINESLPFDWAGKAPNLSERPKRKDRLDRKKRKVEEAAGKKAAGKNSKQETKEDEGKEEAAGAKKKSKEDVKEEDGKDGAAAAAAKKKQSKEEVKEEEAPKPRAKPTKKTTEDHEVDVKPRSESEKSSYSAYLRWKRAVHDKKAGEGKGPSAEKVKAKGSKASKASKQEPKVEGKAVPKIPEDKPKEAKKEVAVEKKPAEVVPVVKKEVVPDKPKEAKKAKDVPTVKAPEVKVAVQPAVKVAAKSKFVNKKKKRNNSKTEGSNTSDGRDEIHVPTRRTRATATEETVDNESKYGKKKAALVKETDKDKKATKSVEEVMKIPAEKPADKPTAAVKKGDDKK